MQSITHTVKVNLRKSGARSQEVALPGDPVMAVRRVLVSEYARADVAPPYLFEATRKLVLRITRNRNYLHLCQRSRQPIVSIKFLSVQQEIGFTALQNILMQTNANASKAGAVQRRSVIVFGKF